VSNFALRLLYDDVKALFMVEAGPDVAVAFGKREPPKQTNRRGVSHYGRVAIVPGDPSGKMGKYGPAKIKRAGLGTRHRRSLGTLLELATIYCAGVDPSALNDEAAQYEATRLIHDYVVRAIYRSPNVGHGSYTLTGPQWIQEDTERKFGAECFFILEIEARIPDEAPGVDIADGAPQITVDTTADPVVYEVDPPDLIAPLDDNASVSATLGRLTVTATATVS